jgi:tetratricopeptide (TPR) repeat protein
VIGRSFSLDLLEELESTRPEAALDALEEAERTHLVRAENVGREPHYRFTHELIRQTFAETLSLPRRQRLHARIAGAMEKVYGAALDKHTPAIAHHLYQAGTSADTQKTLSYLLRAAEGAQHSAAHEEALANLDNAVSLLEGETGVGMGDVHRRRGDALRSLARRSDAVAAYEQAIANFVAAGERVRAASVCVPLFWIHAWAWNWPNFENTLQRYADLIEYVEEPWLKAMFLSAQGLFWTNEGLVEEGLRALAQAETACALGTVSDAHLYLALASGYDFAAQFAHALELQQKASQVSSATGDIWLEVEAAFFSAHLRMYTGPPLEPGQFEATLNSAVRVGNQEVVCSLRNLLDCTIAFRGALNLAERSAKETIAFAESLQAGNMQHVSYANAVVVHDFQGHDDELLDCLHRAFEFEPPVFYASGWSHALGFRALAIRGDAGSIELLRHKSVSMPALGRPNRLGAWVAMTYAVEGLAALSRIEDVAALRQSTEEFLLTGAEFAWLFSTRTAAGIAAACARDWSRAEEHHRAAIHVADTARLRVLQATTRSWYGEMFAAQGDLAQARVWLGEALALYVSIGMPGYARRASEKLSTL